MKILKLLGIFIAVLGIVIGALYIKSALTDTDSDDIKIILPDNVTDQRAEMEDFWNRAVDWDAKHFEAEYSHIQQCLHANYIDHAAANQLTSLLCNLVINRMQGLQLGEYHKSECNIGIVKGYMHLRQVVVYSQQQPVGKSRWFPPMARLRFLCQGTSSESRRLS